MIKKNFISTAKDVINLEIKALQSLKKSINNSFTKAVIQISKCQSKVILCCGRPGPRGAEAACFAAIDACDVARCEVFGSCVGTGAGRGAVLCGA